MCGSEINTTLLYHTVKHTYTFTHLHTHSTNTFGVTNQKKEWYICMNSRPFFFRPSSVVFTAFLNPSTSLTTFSALANFDWFAIIYLLIRHNDAALFLLTISFLQPTLPTPSLSHSQSCISSYMPPHSFVSFVLFQILILIDWVSESCRSETLMLYKHRVQVSSTELFAISVPFLLLFHYRFSSIFCLSVSESFTFGIHSPLSVWLI